ncbi:MAG: DUF4105 domain-containing protein [Proteobacteria bacterium]|nr:DUF4105 domain-containing protein [Pseudomonadota bacterium]
MKIQKSKMMTIRIALLVFVAFYSFSAKAETDRKPSSTSAGSGSAEKSVLEDHIQVRLVTFQPNDDIFEWFGHVAIELKNTLNGKALSYNFGGFSYGPEKMLEFVMGRFTFWSYVVYSKDFLRYYEEKGRHAVFQTLNLTVVQKRTIIRLLAQHTSQQNRFYRYEHFKENCATRIRDIVDETLDGQLKRRTSAPTGLTYRDFVHRMTSHLPHLDFALLFLLNDSVDQPVTGWDSMFLPDRMLVEFQKSLVSSGGGESNYPLVGKRTETVGEEGKSAYFETAAKVPDTRFREYTFGFVLFILLGLSAVYQRNNARFAGTIYPSLVSLFALVFGTMGLVLFFMACFTNHHDTHWNENLFLLNPLTFALLPLGIMKILGKGKRIFALATLLCGTTALIGFALKVLPSFDQANGQQIRTLLPALLVLGLAGLLELKTTSIK